MRSVLATPVVLLLLAACAAAPAVDTAADEQAVRDLSMRWLELDRARDAAALAALFTEDATLFREKRDPIVGRDAIRANFSSEWAAASDAVSTWATDYVEVAASGDMAVEYGTWSEALADGTVRDRGTYVTVYRKVDGTWLVASDASLSTMPDPPADAPATGS